MVGCTNLDLIEVQSDISDIISVDDMEEISATSNYLLVNPFLSKSYGLTEKYDIAKNGMIKQDLESLEEQLESLLNTYLNFMNRQDMNLIYNQ